jgi:hypothetical protein
MDECGNPSVIAAASAKAAEAAIQQAESSNPATERAQDQQGKQPESSNPGNGAWKATDGERDREERNQQLRHREWILKQQKTSMWFERLPWQTQLWQARLEVARRIGKQRDRQEPARDPATGGLIATPFRPMVWEYLLESFPDRKAAQELVRGLREGVAIGYEGPRAGHTRCNNLASAEE